VVVSRAWYEWELHEIDMAVPLSPNEVLLEKKRYFFTISLKGQSNNDSREFWGAEDRNKHTARLYDELGLPNMKLLRLLSDLIIKKKIKRIKNL
jgi:glucosamine-6-phosphate deaminase